MNGTRIIWRILVWLAGILSIILLPAVYVMLIQIVFAHLFTIIIFAAVIVGFLYAAHRETSSKR